MPSKDDFDLSPTERERVRTIELFLDSEPEDGRRVRLRNPMALIPLGVIVLVVGALLWSAQHFGWKRNQGPWWVALVVPTVGVLAASAVFLGMRGNRRGRWRALRAAGYPVCIECGYRLDRRAPGSDHCPECGREDAMQVVNGWPPSAAREPEAPDAQQETP
jgi:hypothetical protein